MKKAIKAFFAASLFCISVLCIACFAACSNGTAKDSSGIEYTLSDNGAYYTVTGYSGKSGEVNIPAEYKDITVKEIGSDAFKRNTTVTAVVIPDSVESIGSHAFYECDSLTSVQMGGNVASIGNGAFFGCESLSTVVIPDSVTAIGSYAFWYCTALENITIGSGVKTIGTFAFFNCTSLTDLVISDSVTYIDNAAFKSCSALVNVTIGSSVSTIGLWAFEDCDSLTYATFNNTDGWYVSTTKNATSGTSLTSSKLTDTEAMAGYLNATYCNYFWYNS